MKTTAPKAFSIAMMGDAMLDRDVGEHFFKKPQDFKFEALNKTLNAYDIILLNLETPVGINGTPHPIQQPRVTFCSHPDTLQILKNLNVTVVALANNHMLDYGPVALGETLDYLDQSGIKYAGASRNYEEANQPALLECNGKKLAFLSYVFIYSASTLAATKNRAGVSDHRIDNILPRIRRLKSQGYQVFVTIHWGHEYSFYPIPYQRRQARQMIDNGATMVIGHGPHYPQGIEDYNGGKIIHSLGNFIFDEPYFYANRSFIYGVEVTEDNRLQNERIYPLHIINHIPTLVNGKDQAWLEKRICALGKIYQRKSPEFWKMITNKWFRDIMFRVRFMRSFKFFTLPPMSFYFEVSYWDYVKYFGEKIVDKIKGRN